jgi:hypothetical protein
MCQHVSWVSPSLRETVNFKTDTIPVLLVGGAEANLPTADYCLLMEMTVVQISTYYPY